MATTDFFLKIADIKGDSADEKHKDEIDIAAWRYEVAQDASRDYGSGLGSGRAASKDILFVAQSSKASPALFKRCASGDHITEMTLACRKNVKGSKQEEYVIIKLSKCLVTKYVIGAQARPELPVFSETVDGLALRSREAMDVFTVAFEKIEIEFRSQKSDLSLDAPVKSNYDFKLNKAG